MALDPTGSKVCLDVIIDVSSGGIRLSGHQQHLLSAYRGCQEKESPRETYSPALHGAGRRRFLRAVFPPCVSCLVQITSRSFLTTRFQVAFVAVVNERLRANTICNLFVNTVTNMQRILSSGRGLREVQCR